MVTARLHLLACIATLYCAGAHAQPPAAADVARSFHEALRTGNVTLVQQLLAADAVIIEGGQVESRDEYLRHHLAADIEFAKAVPSRLVGSQTTLNGATAWVRSANSSTGTFRHRPIRLAGAELMVLTQTASSWEIRAIHWSSYKPK